VPSSDEACLQAARWIESRVGKPIFTRNVLSVGQGRARVMSRPGPETFELFTKRVGPTSLAAVIASLERRGYDRADKGVVVMG